jgi:hypothetical protein
MAGRRARPEIDAGWLSDGDRDGRELSSFREIYCQLGMPGSRLFGHCTLRCHSFFDCTPTIITLVRLHFWPPRRLPPEMMIALKRLRLGKYPQDAHSPNCGRAAASIASRRVVPC